MTATSYIPQVDAAAATRKTRTVQRTDGADTVEEWLQAISEPFLPTYNIVTAAFLTTTVASHSLQIMAGASLRVGLRRLWMYQTVGATTAQCVFQLFRLSTAGTGGTAYTPAPLDTADSASGATAMTLPSSKGTETTLVGTAVRLLHATIGTVGINSDTPMFDFTKNRTKALWIAAGTSNGIALKNVTGVATNQVMVVAEIVESSWA